MAQAEFYSCMAGVTGIIGLIVLGIYWLIRCIVRAIIDSNDQSYETEPEFQDSTVSEVKTELWADASSKSLQLNMAAIEAMNRMNAVASDYTGQDFYKMSKSLQLRRVAESDRMV